VTPARLLQEADRCVKCGMCLPHCPTFRATGNEGDSPRGRVALIQGWASGTLQETPTLERHLALCLGCQACETVCPSEVAFTRLMDGARAARSNRARPWRRRLQRVQLDLLSAPGFLAPAIWVGMRLKRFRLLGQALTRVAPKAQRMLELLPARLEGGPLPVLAKPEGKIRARVALFTGCVSAVTDQAALRSAVTVLNRLGIEVSVPPDQVCCGAMHLHNGNPERARQLAQRNLEAFADGSYDAILSIASGCAVQLREFGALLPSAEPFTRRVQEISAFLNDWPWTEELAPLDARIAVHDPCSLRNGLRNERAPYLLLERIPRVQIGPLAGNEYCCGAAGTYILEQREMSQALLNDKLGSLKDSPPDVVVTSNTGCALQLAAGIRAGGWGIEVMHPIQLLARQLQPRGQSQGGNC